MENLTPYQEWREDNNIESEKQLYLTEKQVRSFPGFENTSDEEVINIINTLHQFSLITYEVITAELNQQMIDNERESVKDTKPVILVKNKLNLCTNLPFCGIKSYTFSSLKP